MHVNEHTQLNRCSEYLSSLPVKHHRFVCDLGRLRKRNPYIPLSRGQRLYLHRLHDSLVRQGVVEGLSA